MEIDQLCKQNCLSKILITCLRQGKKQRKKQEFCKQKVEIEKKNSLNRKRHFILLYHFG